MLNFILLLEAKIKNVNEWKAILDAIADVVEEAMFICNDEGITFRGIDPAHVALLDITFPKSSFESFDCQTSFFGLRVNDFKNVMNAAGNSDVVELQIDNEEKMKVLVNGMLKMEYTLKLLEKTEVNTPIPKVDAKSKATLSPSALVKIISNIEKVAENVTISCLPDKIQFTGKGDIGDAKIDLERNNPELLVLDTSEDSLSTYSLEYMAKIIRSIGRTCKNVNMEYGTKSPMHMLFEMPSMTRVEYYLAPRIDN